VPGGVVVIRRFAGFASLGAGIIHLAAVSEHVAHWWLHGVFFLVLGVVQIGWAVQAMEGGPLPVPREYAVLNAAVIGLWFVSRTTGLPWGPEPWQAEAVGTADLLCSALESVVVVLLVRTMREPQVHESAALTKAQRRTVAVGAVVAAAITVAALGGKPPVFRHAPHSHDHHAAEAADPATDSQPSTEAIVDASSYPEQASVMYRLGSGPYFGHELTICTAAGLHKREL
jgi:hypothetical protein